MRLVELYDMLLLLSNEIVPFLDGLLHLLYLLLRCGYLILELVYLADQLRLLYPELFLEFEIIPLVCVPFASEAQNARLVLILHSCLFLTVLSSQVFHQ
jgi:hypothetical protein